MNNEWAPRHIQNTTGWATTVTEGIRKGPKWLCMFFKKCLYIYYTNIIYKYYDDNDSITTNISVPPSHSINASGSDQRAKMTFYCCLGPITFFLTNTFNAEATDDETQLGWPRTCQTTMCPGPLVKFLFCFHLTIHKTMFFRYYLIMTTTTTQAAAGSTDDGQRVVWPRTCCLTCPGLRYVSICFHLTI